MFTFVGYNLKLKLKLILYIPEESLNVRSKIPPALLLVFFGIVTFFMSSQSFSFVGINQIIGLGLGILAIVIAVVAVLSFKRAKTTVNHLKTENISSLVTRGIFSYSRNPMYVAMALSLFGLGVYMETSLFSAFWTVFFILYLTRFQIVPEEKLLIGLFGNEYKHYCKNVRRWV